MGMKSWRGSWGIISRRRSLRSQGNIFVKFVDSALSLLLAAFFISVVGILLAISKFRKEGKRRIREVVQLYITIVDLQETAIPDQRQDVLLDGFIDKTFCYYFDFEKRRDEHAFVDRNMYIRTVSIRPDILFTRMGFRKVVAYLIAVKTFFAMLKTPFHEDVNIVRAQDPHFLGFNAYVLSRLLKAPLIIQVCSNYEIKDRQAKGLTFRPFAFQVFEKWFERSMMR